MKAFGAEPPPSRRPARLGAATFPSSESTGQNAVVRKRRNQRPWSRTPRFDGLLRTTPEGGCALKPDPFPRSGCGGFAPRADIMELHRAPWFGQRKTREGTFARKVRNRILVSFPVCWHFGLSGQCAGQRRIAITDRLKIGKTIVVRDIGQVVVRKRRTSNSEGITLWNCSDIPQPRRIVP